MKKVIIITSIVFITLAMAAGLTWFFVANKSGKKMTVEQAQQKIQYLPQSPKEKALGIKPIKVEGINETVYDFSEYDSKPENKGKSPAEALGL